MKASAYYEKYKDKIFDLEAIDHFTDGVANGTIPLCHELQRPDFSPSQMFLKPDWGDAVHEMYKEFVDEITPIMQERNVKTNIGYAAIVKEQNQKWNALRRIFCKKHQGFPVIRENAVTEIFRKYLPNDIRI